MKAELLDYIQFREGFHDSLPENDPRDYMIVGSKNLIYMGDGRLRSFKGVGTVSGTGTARMYPFGAGFAGLTTEGSVFAGNGLALFFIGAGTVYLNGTSLAVSASTSLSFRLFSGGVYTGSTFTSGLAAPSACTLYVKTGGVSGNILGTVSAKVSRVRNSTGAESNGSDSSNVVTFNSEQAVLQFNDTTSNGSDRWRIYLTPSGFGRTGPSYFWKEIQEADLSTIDGHARSYQINFADSDLQAKLAPIDYNVPPVGVWAFQLESVHAVVGAYGDQSGISTSSPGNAIAVSRVNKPEAYPADYLLWLPAAPTGIAQRASDAFTFVFGKSYLGVCSFTGGTPPLAYRTIWANTGFAAYHNVTIGAGGQLYGFSSQRGPIRILPDEGPDTEFARPIAKTVESWTAANVVVGWDSDHTKIVFMHGSTLLAFNTTLERWDAPVDISVSPMSIAGSVASCATNGSSLAFSVNNTGTYTPYSYNAGTSGSVWEVLSTWRTGGAAENLKTLGPLRGSFRHDDATTHPNVVTKIYRNYSTVSAQKTVTTITTATGAQHLPSVKCNVRNAKSYAVYQTAQAVASGSGESAPIDFKMMGTRNEVRK